MRGFELIDLLAGHSEEQAELWLPYAAEVSSRSSGMVITREPVTLAIDEQAYAFVPGFSYDTGDEVLMIPVGGGEAVVMKTARSLPTVLKPDAPLIGQTYVQAKDATNAETLNTNNTATYVDALTLTWSGSGAFGIPNGTYNFAIVASANFAGSTGNNIDLQLTVGATVGTGVQSAVPTGTLPGVANRVATSEALSGIVVSSGITIVLKYKGASGGTGGTAYCRNPAIHAVATRTA